jgi:hypothetical protein
MEFFHQAREGLSSLLESDDAEQTHYPRIAAGESIGELTRLMIVRKALCNLHYDGRVCRRSTR